MVANSRRVVRALPNAGARLHESLPGLGLHPGKVRIVNGMPTAPFQRDFGTTIAPTR